MFLQMRMKTGANERVQGGGRSSYKPSTGNAATTRRGFYRGAQTAIRHELKKHVGALTYWKSGRKLCGRWTLKSRATGQDVSKKSRKRPRQHGTKAKSKTNGSKHCLMLLLPSGDNIPRGGGKKNRLKSGLEEGYRKPHWNLGTQGEATKTPGKRKWGGNWTLLTKRVLPRLPAK